MRSRSFLQALFAAAFVLLPLGWLAATNELALRSGNEYWIETAGLDPRDLLRGDYVAYRFPALDLSEHAESLGAESPQDLVADHADRRLIAMMAVGDDQLLSLQAFTWERPASGTLYIQGRVGGSRTPPRLVVPAERYFVPEGSGRELEQLDRPFARVSISPRGQMTILNIVPRQQVLDNAPATPNQ